MVPLRALQPFLAPQLFHLLVIASPALGTEEFSDLAIVLSPILLRQPNQSQTQRIIVSVCWLILKRAPREANDSARSPLRRRERLTFMNVGLTKLLCDQGLCFMPLPCHPKPASHEQFSGIVRDREVRSLIHLDQNTSHHKSANSNVQPIAKLRPMVLASASHIANSSLEAPRSKAFLNHSG